MVVTSCGSCVPSIRPADASRCGHSCGSYVCRRVGSTPGDAGTPCVHSNVCTRRSVVLSAHVAASDDAIGDPGDRGYGDVARHVPTGTLAVLAQRLGTVWASASTRYRLVRRFRLATAPVPSSPRETQAGASNHSTQRDVAYRHDRHSPAGTRAYLHAVIDNFSRRILAWRVAESFAPVNTVAVLLDASRAATASDAAPVVLADAGVENVNAQVDELITAGVLRRVLAFTELQFSNSMIEAWWRSLKHQWLFLHSLDRVTTVRRLVEFYVDEHNRVLPHSAFHGQTPDEMYFGTGDAVPADLTSGAAAARRARAEANRSAACETCPSLDTAA
jgi:putative transposase